MSEKPIAYVEAASTLAVVVASHEPLLFLSDDLKIISASASFCRNFEIDPATVSGKRLSELGNGEWASPKLASLLQATSSGIAQVDAYEIDLKRHDRKTHKVLVNARTLDDGNEEQVRLLVAITDVTDARAEARLKEDLLREKGILLQEVQHRVANSLQIIASVLMQSARQTQSIEARGHIHNAHQRVMAIASVQRQLSASVSGNVDLRIYLTQLCKSLAASMIIDPARISIAVKVDGSAVEADVSLSLGLIVTELVINALKHAFPDQKSGTITVSYHASGDDWTLSVADNGIGMEQGPAAPKAGLGTGIVEALAKNLMGQLLVSDANPGTSVTITYRATGTMDISPPKAA